MKRNTLEMIFFFSIVTIGIVLLLFIFKPYFTVLFLASILTVIFFPVYSWIRKKLKERKTVSSLITVVLIFVTIFLPLFILGTLLFQEAKNVTVQLQQGGGVMIFLDKNTALLEGYLNHLAPDANFHIDVRGYIQNSVAWLAGNFGVFLSGLAVGFANLFLMIFAVFFFLRDGEEIRATLIKWSPLEDTNDKRVLDRMTVAINSIIKGSIFMALIQGFLAGIGFWIFGVPSPILWGFVAMVAAFIPSVGTALVVVPAWLYLFFSGAPLWALIGLLAWGVGGVGTIDNFLRPVLIKRGIEIHPFLILLSVLGGLSFFGPIGFLIGPIVLSFVFALIEVSPKIISSE